MAIQYEDLVKFIKELKFARLEQGKDGQTIGDFELRKAIALHWGVTDYVEKKRIDELRRNRLIDKNADGTWSLYTPEQLEMLKKKALPENAKEMSKYETER